MNRTVLTVVVKNLALLSFVAMPVFFILVWLQALFGQAFVATDLGDSVDTGSGYYLAISSEVGPLSVPSSVTQHEKGQEATGVGPARWTVMD